MKTELIDYSLIPAPWAIQAGYVEVFAGIDLGVSVHPTHVSVLAHWGKKFFQIASVWLERERLSDQVTYFQGLFTRLNVEFCLFDNTRSELTVLAERGEMPGPMLYGGVVLTFQEKHRLASQLLIALERGELILLDDSRQTRSLQQVNALLKATEIEGVGHGDALISNMLAIEAARRRGLLGGLETKAFVIPLGGGNRKG